MRKYILVSQWIVSSHTGAPDMHCC